MRNVLALSRRVSALAIALGGASLIGCESTSKLTSPEQSSRASTTVSVAPSLQIVAFVDSRDQLRRLEARRIRSVVAGRANTPFVVPLGLAAAEPSWWSRSFAEKARDRATVAFVRSPDKRCCAGSDAILVGGPTSNLSDPEYPTDWNPATDP